MHRAGVDNLVLLEERRIAPQGHAARETSAWRIALHSFAHRAEIFFAWLTRRRRRNSDGVIVLLTTATGMRGRIAFNVTFHQVTVRRSR